jgi:uncharacterized membrane protein HdeD (DUF308 family)
MGSTPGCVFYDMAQVSTYTAHFILGILLILASLFIFGATFFTSILTVIFLGWFLLIGGLIGIISIFFSPINRFTNALLGVFSTIIGFWIISHPLILLSTLTLLFAVLFTVMGLMQMLASIFSDMENKWIAFLSGLINFILGVLVWSGWPGSTTYVFGIFIGIYFLTAGISLIFESLAIKKIVNKL